jgi:enoyl-CoA hydratase/carnithine racemase
MSNPDVLSTHISGGVAVITLGSEKRIFFDPEMSDALHLALLHLAADEAVRVIIVTGGAPGYFVRHYSVAALIQTGETIAKSGRGWAEDAPYQAGSFDKAMALVEAMEKPVIAAICDIRIAQEGDFQLGLPEINVGILPGGGGTQRLPRAIGTPKALLHILMGVTLDPVEAARQGFVQETVKGKALDRAMEIAARIATHTPESVRYIKRLVRGAEHTPLAQGLALERNLFMKLCIGEPALERMRAYEAQRITAPSQPLR